MAIRRGSEEPDGWKNPITVEPRHEPVTPESYKSWREQSIAAGTYHEDDEGRKERYKLMNEGVIGVKVPNVRSIPWSAHRLVGKDYYRTWITRVRKQKNG